MFFYQILIYMLVLNSLSFLRKMMVAIEYRSIWLTNFLLNITIYHSLPSENYGFVFDDDGITLGSDGLTLKYHGLPPAK